MRKTIAEDIDLKRRAFLLESGTAFCAVLLASLLFSGSDALAKDGEDDSDDDDGGDDDGGDDHGGSDDDDDEDDDHDDDDEDEEDGGGNSGPGGGRDDDEFERGTLDQSDAVRAVRTGKAIPLKAALKRVESRYKGVVIDVELQATSRRLEYRFKIRTERGTVRTIRMNAETGRFLGFGALFR